MRRADGGAVGHEALGLELRQRLVGQADLVEGGVDVADGQVLGDVEGVRHVGGVEDKVELERQRLLPALLVVEHELFGAQLHGVVLLARRVRDHRDLGAESRGPEDGKVPEAAHADDGHLLALGDARPHEWRPDRQARAHHGRGVVRGNLVGYGEDEVFVGADVGCVAALCDGLIGVDLFGVRRAECICRRCQ